MEGEADRVEAGVGSARAVVMALQEEAVGEALDPEGEAEETARVDLKEADL